MLIVASSIEEIVFDVLMFAASEVGQFEWRATELFSHL